jgi:hypothetical protein
LFDKCDCWLDRWNPREDERQQRRELLDVGVVLTFSSSYSLNASELSSRSGLFLLPNRENALQSPQGMSVTIKLMDSFLFCLWQSCFIGKKKITNYNKWGEHNSKINIQCQTDQDLLNANDFIQWFFLFKSNNKINNH